MPRMTKPWPCAPPVPSAKSCPCDATLTMRVGQLSTLMIVAAPGSQNDRQYCGRCFFSSPTTRRTSPPLRSSVVFVALIAMSEFRNDLPLS